MVIINFIIAVIALIIAVMAFRRSGGAKDFREVTANALAKMEQGLRKMEAETKKGDDVPPSGGSTP